MTNLEQKVTKGAIWVLCEKLSCQAVNFVVGMILSRLLSPTDYGTVALTVIFFAVANVFIDGGFGVALIQKKDSDELDFNSVFYVNLLLSVIAYVLLYFGAPWISEFYNTPILTRLIRISAISFFFNAVSAVQVAELTKKMLFHLSFRVSLITTFTSAVFGLTLAFLGYGVWAIVYSSLASGLVGVISLWFIIAWRPKMMFSVKRLKPLFAYGWKMSATSMIDKIFTNINGLLIGKFYSKEILAFVNKGQSLPELLINQIDGTIGKVSFPALVQFQNDKTKLRDAMRRMMIVSTFLVFPLMAGIAACAKSVVLLLFGEKWLPAVPYLMLTCFYFSLWPLHTINLRGIMVLGRSDIFLILEIIKKTLNVIVLLYFFRFGVFSFMCAIAFTLGPLGMIINAWPNKKLLNYPLRMQMMDILPTIIMCIAETAVVFGVDYGMESLGSVCGIRDLSGWGLISWLLAKLFVQFVFGAGTFLGLAYYFKVKALPEYVRAVPVRVKMITPRFFDRIEKRLNCKTV